MLQIVDITKDYPLDKDESVHALKGISLSFPDSGFVAILGPSGCGKTTLLNILSGLDRYTSGDLIIDGTSTRDYTSRMWDDYRNKKVGMVFQSYNLIPHLNVWENVALPLTLAGYSRREKWRMSLKALDKVGLKDHAKKRPNQLSGGQQQRIAIARAIVGSPHIILADEPTGALDTQTSVQVMDILANLSSTRLVVMVTHNRELAYRYADRIITMRDGQVLSDIENVKVPEPAAAQDFSSSMARRSGSSRELRLSLATRRTRVSLPEEAPLYESASVVSEREEQKANTDSDQPTEQSGKNRRRRKSSMSFGTAFVMSWRNLMSKKGRTTLTSIAASIGIIGVALVLAVSNGFSNYISELETEALSQFPITITAQTLAIDSSSIPDDDLESYPDDDTVHVTPSTSSYFHYNSLTSEFYEDYLSQLDSSLYTSIQLGYSTTANVITKTGNGNYVSIDTSSTAGGISTLISSAVWQELPGDEDFILSQYDLIAGEYPDEDDPTGLLITVDEYNSLSANTLASLGYDSSEFPDGTITDISFDDLASKTYRLFSNDDYYIEGDVNDSVRGLALLDPDSYSDFITLLSRLSSSSDVTEEDLEEAAVEIIGMFADIPDDLSTSDLLPIMTILYSFVNGNITWDDAILNLFDAIEDAGIEINPVTSMTSFSEPEDNSEEMANLYEYGNLEGVSGDDRATDLHIVGILRPKSTTTLGILGNGIYYTSALSTLVTDSAAESKISQECADRLVLDFSTLTDGEARELIQGAIDGNLTEEAVENISDLLRVYSIYDSSEVIDQSTYMTQRGEVGTDAGVTSITIYPKDYDSKDRIIAFLDAYNEGKDESEQIVYSDIAGTVTSIIGTIVDVVSAVLIVFASISLIVSSVMIAIIIYVSVIERTKEIGTLRAVGARRRDVTRLFIMESVTIGLLAGVIGVLATYILSIPINLILNSIFSSYSLGAIANLNPVHGLILIAISVALTFIAGYIPSKMAGRKDPVTCLRTE